MSKKRSGLRMTAWRRLYVESRHMSKKRSGLRMRSGRASLLVTEPPFLLGARADIHAKVLLDGCRIFEEFKGALTEQFLAQQLRASDRYLYYYSTENSTGEIDFVIQQEMRCIPNEVKAEENLRAKSLHAFVEKYKPEIAVRSSMSNFREQDWMVNVPLYALVQYLER